MASKHRKGRKLDSFLTPWMLWPCTSCPFLPLEIFEVLYEQCIQRMDYIAKPPKIVFSPSSIYTSLRILESTLFPLKYTFRQAPESTAEPLNSRPDARHLSNGVQKTRVTHRLCIDKTRSSLVTQWHHWNYLVKQLGMWIFLVFLCYPNCLPRTSQQPINRARPGW